MGYLCNNFDNDHSGMVGMASSISFFLVWIFRPANITSISKHVDEPTSWRVLMLDLLVEDIPSLCLNAYIMSLGTPSFAAQFSLLFTILSVLRLVYKIRQQD